MLRRVVSQARDDTALQNWGVIWLLHSLTNFAGFFTTNLLLRGGDRSPWPYVALWATTLTVNIGSIFVLKSSAAGVRSFIESQIWVIWNSFIVVSGIACVLNYVMGMDRLFAGVVMALFAAFAFAMMGSVMGRRWYAWAAAFAIAAVAMALAPGWQFAIFGAVWGVAQAVGGAMLVMEKRRRLAAGGGAAPRLV